ncbi:MAG: hypothetical protein ACJA2Y_001159 [Cycloclasticus pugetii]|jgi:hypothetical protein|uniref:DUF2797 domain-containing protein n=1 Tax=Cycloclasticus zancles 78-ME TaxID=1198232 RepID=S5TYP4_9GAMM|nr:MULTISPECIES: DUF2797 domain-containing protein [Cycloclasticus]AFT66666.1 Signal transduction histidine kinase [Cycloclasticus sp. P1]AGS40285.1 hypothetical protein CYCME_1971 [Cycloclasticus zancles 78-ME]MBV1898229.1 DUF2797 domain-containing protein [Cycloclasticus sp.]SHI97556.1 Protein of unknown function [Cycloclasticus pugetii]|tara:strand:- start:702 stop:1520 length:819 start_codon:yes stop_codon:yes gene_type:complete
MIEGHLKKMLSTLSNPVEYVLPIGDERIGLNQYLGKTIALTYEGEINCLNCGKRTKKSYSQGFCYYCMTKLAQCDLCIMKPETCHYHLGTCREPQWGEEFCFQDHFVYLANSSGLKVGITRHTQVPTRWIDQGATQALPIFKVRTRLQSGQVEMALKQHVSDKTDWRKMLKGQADHKNLYEHRDRLIEAAASELSNIQAANKDGDIELIKDAKQVEINYPVVEYPQKVTSFNFDKTARVEGRLMGIKGQYLILDSGVLNIRKFTSYKVQFDA